MLYQVDFPSKHKDITFNDIVERCLAGQLLYDVIIISGLGTLRCVSPFRHLRATASFTVTNLEAQYLKFWTASWSVVSAYEKLEYNFLFLLEDREALKQPIDEFRFIRAAIQTELTELYVLAPLLWLFWLVCCVKASTQCQLTEQLCDLPTYFTMLFASSVISPKCVQIKKNNIEMHLLWYHHF